MRQSRSPGSVEGVIGNGHSYSDFASPGEVIGQSGGYAISFFRGSRDGSPSGVRIEVKSAAYLQTWAYAKLSTISFSVRPLLSHKLSSDSKEELRW